MIEMAQHMSIFYSYFQWGMLKSFPISIGKASGNYFHILSNFGFDDHKGFIITSFLLIVYLKLLVLVLKASNTC